MIVPQAEKVFRDLIEVLEENRIPYMVMGGFAVCHWAIERATFDVDFPAEVREGGRRDRVTPSRAADGPAHRGPQGGGVAEPLSAAGSFTLSGAVAVTASAGAPGSGLAAAAPFATSPALITPAPAPPAAPPPPAAASPLAH